VNKQGHPATLVASHPGNQNAVRHGVYSQRLIEPRAAEIEAELRESHDFSATDGLVLEQVARFKATLEAIVADVDQRGLVNRKGKAHPLLSYQLRVSRLLESAVATISAAIEERRREQEPEGSTPLSTDAGDAADTAEPEDEQRRIKIAVELESEIRAAKPNAVRVSALVALDRIRRQPATDEDIPGMIHQLL
jgi:hypothetical protein